MVDGEGVTVARILIQRVIGPDGEDNILVECDDGHDDGDAPALVEMLGMLEMTKDTVLRGELYEDGE